MTPYVGCDYARERLEALLDDELSVDEQVLVESHVRWCRTCGAVKTCALCTLPVRRQSASGERLVLRRS